MKKYLIILLVGLISSCKPSLEAINFHEDECAYCKMIISDPKFAAELVSKTGKVFKYDSAECLIKELKGAPTEKYTIMAVSDYNRDQVFIDADKAIFLISEGVPSPMGANLSSYSDRQSAETVRQAKGGEIYSFDEILKKLP